MAAHPDAPEFVPLFCRVASAGAPPPLPPTALPEGDAPADDSMHAAVFFADYALAGVPPNAPFMPAEARSPLTHSTSHESSLSALPHWLARQRAERRARLLWADQLEA